MRALTAALALAVTGCGAGQGDAAPAPRAAGRAAPTNQEPAPPPPPPPVATATAPAADADRVVQRALQRVVQLRHLAATGPVRGKVVSRDEMIALVKTELHTEVPSQVLAAESEELFALGTVPADFDYEKSVLSLMTSQLAGFYEPSSKTMVLGGDLEGSAREETLDHELVHALQDQHYDLGPKLAYRDDASDEQGALHALAEGDATSAMLDAMLASKGQLATDIPDAMIEADVAGAMALSPSIADIPPILRRSLVAPYLDGIMLVHWARRRGGWAAVDALWRDPPTTTEQLLHPAKLVKREPADVVPVPPAPPNGPGTVVYHDVMGEESLRLLFEEWMPERTAIAAASDWGGDRIAVFGDGDHYALGWRLRFDTRAAAQRALVAFVRGVLGGRSTSLAVARREARRGVACRERADAGPFAVAGKGRDLVLVAGPYERHGTTARSGGDCTAAIAWTTAIFHAGS